MLHLNLKLRVKPHKNSPKTNKQKKIATAQNQYQRQATKAKQINKQKSVSSVF